MPEIREKPAVVTQITTVKMRPDNQDEVLGLMKERARFMSGQPGFVSVSLHRSEDGSHVVNYIQWKRAAQGRASLAGIPQEVAEVRRARAGRGARHLRRGADRGGVSFRHPEQREALGPDQRRTQRMFLDSGFAPPARPGMTMQAA